MSVKHPPQAYEADHSMLDWLAVSSSRVLLDRYRRLRRTGAGSDGLADKPRTDQQDRHTSQDVLGPLRPATTMTHDKPRWLLEQNPSDTTNRMVTFRDPDNVQLELFWEGPRD